MAKSQSRSRSRKSRSRSSKSRSRSRSRSCSSGYIKRKGYTRRAYTRSDGTRVKAVRVKAGCIRGTSALGIKRSERDKKILASRSRSHERIKRKYGSAKCGKGQTQRAGYVRNSYSRRSRSGSRVRVSRTEVKPGCVKSVSRSRSRGTKIPVVLEKGDLKKYGYSNVNSLTLSERHSALRKAAKNIPHLSLYRKVNILSTLNKNKNPTLARKFRSDAEWVKKEFGLSSSRSRSRSRSRK